MIVVPTVVQDCLMPGVSLALDRVLLARAVAERRPWLRVCTWPGDVLLLGRYHPALAGAGVYRRLSGGRAVPAGAGFVQVSLALPHRSALESDEPYALRPEQVLNRSVRGIMGGLELLGIEPYYPGRDVITVGGKAIAWISLAVEEAGATLIEAGVAVERGLDLLARLADRLDPEGAVPVTLWQESDTTTIASVLKGRAPALREVGLAIVEGYRRRLALEPSMEDVAVPQQEVAVETIPLRPRAQRASALGALLASARLTADGLLDDVWLGGDVIAPVATMRGLAQALGGQPPDYDAVRRAMEPVLARPDAFLLGTTPGELTAVALAAVGR